MLQKTWSHRSQENDPGICSTKRTSRVRKPQGPKRFFKCKNPGKRVYHNTLSETNRARKQKERQNIWPEKEAPA